MKVETAECKVCDVVIKQSDGTHTHTRATSQPSVNPVFSLGLLHNQVFDMKDTVQDRRRCSFHNPPASAALQAAPIRLHLSDCEHQFQPAEEVLAH